MRARFWFTIATIAAAVGLLGWGAFVTSIDAGLAVPDWPTSFESYDPFNPWPNWWEVTPILAEHGHRLAGALVGFLTLILAVWTGFADSRVWMKRLGYAALALVIFQGLLGGLRVVWVSLDLAILHACTAQIFFSLLAAMALFTSSKWEDPGPPPTVHISRAGWIAVAAVFIQIIFGALLRHPGIGIDPMLAGIHMGWAFVALLTVYVHARVLNSAEGLRSLGSAILGVVAIQITLGFVAYFVLLDEQGVLQPSNLQVLVNSLHLIVGAALLSLNVVGALVTRRSRRLVPIAS